MKNPTIYDKFFNIGKIAFQGMLVLSAFGIGGIILLKNEENAKETLEKNGYTQVKIDGYNLFCAENTPIAATFTAVSPNKEEVVGRICAGRLLLDDNIETQPKNKMK